MGGDKGGQSGHGTVVKKERRGWEGWKKTEVVPGPGLNGKIIYKPKSSR